MPAVGRTTTLIPFARRRGARAWFESLAANQGFVVNPGFGPDRPVAEVNHGRWIAFCPFCRGAEMVDPGEPIFFCLSCGNAEAGFRFLRVDFPSPPGMREIEDVLDPRPSPNQNWHAGETVAQLMAENEAFLHGNQTPPRHPVPGRGR